MPSILNNHPFVDYAEKMRDKLNEQIERLVLWADILELEVGEPGSICFIRIGT